LLIKIKNKKQNKFIISERLYIGITDTINGFRSTLACCEAAKSAFKRLILETPLYQHILLIVDYEFHPDVQQTERRRVREGARHTTAPNLVWNPP
jgi:hypothetical protein